MIKIILKYLSQYPDQGELHVHMLNFLSDPLLSITFYSATLWVCIISCESVSLWKYTILLLTADATSMVLVPCLTAVMLRFFSIDEQLKDDNFSKNIDFTAMKETVVIWGHLLLIIFCSWKHFLDFTRDKGIIRWYYR